MIDPQILLLQNGRLAWLVGIFAAILIIVTLLKRINTGVDEIVTDTNRSHRHRKLSRIEQQESDIRFLMSEVSNLKEGMRLRDRLTEVHSRWDHQMIMLLIKLDPSIEIDEPPSLVPPDPIAREEMDDKNAST